MMDVGRETCVIPMGELCRCVAADHPDLGIEIRNDGTVAVPVTQAVADALAQEAMAICGDTRPDVIISGQAPVWACMRVITAVARVSHRCRYQSSSSEELILICGGAP